jgi:hypothetical protein
VTQETVPVSISLSVAANNTGTVRMTPAATQNNGEFRGIQDLWLVPFKKAGKITAENTVENTPLPLIQSTGEKIPFSNGAAKYFFQPEAMKMQLGTASFLAYGRATNDDSAPATYGKLTASYTSGKDFTPANVTFTPVSISDEAANTDKATLIAQYLTNIAKENWYTSADAGVAELFNNFANIHNSSPEPFAGSSTNILKHVNETFATVRDHIADPLKTEILDAIKDAKYVTFDNTNNVVTALSGTVYDMTGYPVNLPEGVAGMKWNKSTNKFESRPGNYFENYVYPAELYYFANSRIYTSTEKKEENFKTGTDADTWVSFTSREYENKGTDDEGTAVDADTRSIALIEPLQYGVACLEVQIRAGLANLRHAGTGVVALSPSTTEPAAQGTFPLTAILVGGQHIQGFDFTPKYPGESTATEDKEYIIYDKSIEGEGVCLGDHIKNGEAANFSKSLYTLTLQTKKDNSVKVVLEFLNNSDTDFKCNSGIIYRNTKFYLMASVVNLETSDLERDKQVLTKDHKSKILLTISDLSSAYNALPSLSSDKVRLFETVTAGISDWQTGSTPSTEIHNW